MQERGIIVVALLLVMVAFLSTSFSDGNFEGYAVKGDPNKVSCSQHVKLMDGYIVVLCNDGYLDYDRAFYP